MNYCLDLPPWSHAHNVFHVEKLLPAYDQDRLLFPTSDGAVPDKDPVTNDLGDYYEEEYEVERLVGHWYDSKGNLQYKVHWLRFSKEDNSWQTLEDLSSAPEAIQDYWQSLSYATWTKHDAILKKMITNTPDKSLLKSGNVREKYISLLFPHEEGKI